MPVFRPDHGAARWRPWLISSRISSLIDELEESGSALEAGIVADGTAAAAVELLVDDVVGREVEFGEDSMVGMVSSRQSLQILRTSRWARMASSVAVIRNGGTPMSRSRVIVLGASLVCSVLKTMWPVSDACTAISAVSRSRISPTRILSGSWRRIDRRHWAKVLPIAGVDGHLHDAVDVVLDRVLGGDELVLDRVQLVQGGVERGGLAASRSGR